MVIEEDIRRIRLDGIVDIALSVIYDTVGSIQPDDINMPEGDID